MRDRLEPGTPIEICHIVDGMRWGYPEDCSSKWHKHGRTRYVLRHYPGLQVQYVDSDPTTWDEEHLGRQRVHAVPDETIDETRRAWRVKQ